MEIHDKIRQIVADHSGGVKFTELITELQSAEKGKLGFTPEEIEDICRHINGLEVLEYGMLMGEVTRVKMFIYTPLPGCDCERCL